MNRLILLLSTLLSLTRSFDLIPAVFTPFTNGGQGEVDLSKVSAYTSFLKNVQNITTVFVGGTNGESLSLTTAERKELLKAWVDEPGMKVIAHVGAESIVDAIALASHALSLGVSSVAAMPPTFFRPSTVSELVAWFKPLAAAAAPLPIKYYHIPSMTNVALDMSEFLTLASSEIPNFEGIKYTDTDLYTFTKCVAETEGGVKVKIEGWRDGRRAEAKRQLELCWSEATV